MLNMISTKPQVGILSIILSPIIFVIEVKAWLCPTINIQSKELFKFLDTYGYSKALVVTFSEKESHYRFSLITSDLNWIGTKVNKEFSNPKRL